MKEHKAIIIADLGPGDGGKGGVVHKVCIEKGTHTVIKIGGCQGSHGVRTSSGETFNFSQFGCGTLEGRRTHISDQFVMDPIGIVSEARALGGELRVQNVWELLTVDERALCVTPYHAASSRLRELARKDKPKGTIGVGAGETKRDSEAYPGLAICAGDLHVDDLRDKIAAVRTQKLSELSDILDNRDSFFESDFEEAKKDFDLLNHEDSIDWTLEKFKAARKLMNIVPPDFCSRILGEGVVVFEASHGILTDRYHGFHPYTSRLRTVPVVSVKKILDECSYSGEVKHLGVTRAFAIRHGAGPLPTYSQEFTANLMPGSHKHENRYQGKVRAGPLDFVLLRYAIEVCGGPGVFDGIAVTWFDQIKKNGQWPTCTCYDNVPSELFADRQHISVRYAENDEHYIRQNRLAHALESVRPVIVQSGDKSMLGDDEAAIDWCYTLIKEELGVPVRMVSIGPTENEKVLV